MTDLYLLVHAPVLGPASWLPVAGQLKAAGRRVAVPALTGFAAGGPPYAPRLVRQFAEQARAALAEVPDAGRVMLVVHSGAGPFAAQLAAALPEAPVTITYVDAGLPALAGPTPVVDGGFLPYLRELARDGQVPPWPRWFPEADPAEIFPSEAARAAIAADARSLPWSFFAEELAPVAQPRPSRYVLLSEAYTAEAEQARRRGWPVAEVPGSHLHMLVDPAAVAAALVGR